MRQKAAPQRSESTLLPRKIGKANVEDTNDNVADVPALVPGRSLEEHENEVSVAFITTLKSDMNHTCL